MEGGDWQSIFLLERRRCGDFCKWNQLLGEVIEEFCASSEEDEGKERGNCHFYVLSYI